jgi:hypothetical protein
MTDATGSAFALGVNRFLAHDLFTVLRVTRSRALCGHFFGCSEFVGDLPILGGPTPNPVHETVRLYHRGRIGAFEVVVSVVIRIGEVQNNTRLKCIDTKNGFAIKEATGQPQIRMTKAVFLIEDRRKS